VPAFMPKILGFPSTLNLLALVAPPFGSALVAKSVRGRRVLVDILTYNKEPQLITVTVLATLHLLRSLSQASGS